MLKIVINYLLALFFVLSGVTQAQEPELEDGAVTKIAVHIHAQDYNHQIRLWQNFRDYWYAQGPLLEKEAIKELKQAQREPKLIVLENVCGALSANAGKDFIQLCAALAQENYRFGGLVREPRYPTAWCRISK